jgi:predicted alpha/beta hydrolase
MTHRHTVTTPDGFDLAATAFGDSRTCRAGVLIVPAMGVEQHFYAAFAHWLAEQGFFVVSFDYRGMGHSRPSQYRRSLRGFEADVFTWAQRDCAAMVHFVAARIGAKPLLWVGHSLGGQILGLVPNRERVAAMMTVATGSGYWLENSPKLRSYVWWLWYVAAPLSLRLFGYFPGRKLRKIGDLPAGVMAQWRRWCLNRDYLVGAEGDDVQRRFREVKTPILSLSFTDDEYMSLRNTESLHGFYASAPREMKRIDPRAIGEPRVGHFGFFRRRSADKLWPQAAAWLAAQAERRRAGHSEGVPA